MTQLDARYDVRERFFVKIIVVTPPPTNSFRWCTKNLRIKPVSRFIAEAAKGDAIVSLGMRRTESRQRERAIDGHGGGHWQTQFRGRKAIPPLFADPRLGVG